MSLCSSETNISFEGESAMAQLAQGDNGDSSVNESDESSINYIGDVEITDLMHVEHEDFAKPRPKVSRKRRVNDITDRDLMDAIVSVEPVFMKRKLLPMNWILLLDLLLWE